MSGHILRVIIFALLLAGCKKEGLYIDPEYPSVYYEISGSELSQMRSSLASDYEYIRSTLNEFGFCYLPDNYIITKPPELSYLLTGEDARELAYKFVLEHHAATGIADTSNLRISRIYSLPGETHWTVVSSLQKADTIEILYTEIVICIINGEIVSCEGNWYPEVYIPGIFNFTEEIARLQLIGKDVPHHSMTGAVYYVTITGADLENSTADLKVVPRRTDGKIGLRVTWMFNIPGPVYCRVYMDVMTGEVILMMPTIIS